MCQNIICMDVKISKKQNLRPVVKKKWVFKQF